MRSDEKAAFIRRVSTENPPSGGSKVLWSTHAVQKLVAEGLGRLAVEMALARCDVIEDYPDSHRPLPDCSVLGFLAGGYPIHAVVGLDVLLDRILMITVYRPSQERWDHDWKTRKS